MGKLPAAVVGATGNVGQKLVGLLQDHPFFELTMLCASARSQGGSLAEAWRQEDFELSEAAASLPLEAIDPGAIARRGIEVVFSALPAEIATKGEEGMARLGLKVFSDASAHRMDPDVPLLVPEVNPDHLELIRLQGRRFREGGFVVTVPNCSIAGLSLPLRALRGALDFREVFVSTYQAISGAGYPGVPALDITANVIPYIEREEEKMRDEARKILGTPKHDHIADADLRVEAHCARVPVREGHLETATVVLREEADAEAAVEALRTFRGLPQRKGLPTAPHEPIVVRREVHRPQPILDLMAGRPRRARGMAVTVGRVRASGRYLKFVVLSHNTLRGGAGGNVLNAELAMALGYLG